MWRTKTNHAATLLAPECDGDSGVSAAAPPEPSKRHQIHPSIKTPEPLSPSKVEDVFNGTDDGAFSSFMDSFVSPPGFNDPPASSLTHAMHVVDHSPGKKTGNARRSRRRKSAKRGDLSTFKKRITSNTYLRRLYLSRQQAFALAPSLARVAEIHDPTKNPATTASTSVTVLDEDNVAHELECKCYLSSRVQHFVLSNGWSALSNGSGVALGDAVVFSRVGGDQGCLQIICVKGGGG